MARTEVLAGMVDEVERRLREIPSVMSLDTDLGRATDEVQVQILYAPGCRVAKVPGGEPGGLHATVSGAGG